MVWLRRLVRRGVTLVFRRLTKLVILGLGVLKRGLNWVELLLCVVLSILSIWRPICHLAGISHVLQHGWGMTYCWPTLWYNLVQILLHVLHYFHIYAFLVDMRWPSPNRVVQQHPSLHPDAILYVAIQIPTWWGCLKARWLTLKIGLPRVQIIRGLLIRLLLLYHLSLVLR